MRSLIWPGSSISSRWLPRFVDLATEAPARFVDVASVIGFQVDNETGTAGAQNPSIVDAFVEHIKRICGTVDRVNEIWGLTYWSHRLGEWADLWPPETTRVRATTSIGDWVLRASGVEPLGTGLPESMRLTRSCTREGRTLSFVSNWSFDSHVLPEDTAKGENLLAETRVGPASPLQLGPWDIQIVVDD